MGKSFLGVEVEMNNYNEMGRSRFRRRLGWGRVMVGNGDERMGLFVKILSEILCECERIDEDSFWLRDKLGIYEIKYINT